MDIEELRKHQWKEIYDSRQKSIGILIGYDRNKDPIAIKLDGDTVIYISSYILRGITKVAETNLSDSQKQAILKSAKELAADPDYAMWTMIFGPFIYFKVDTVETLDHNAVCKKCGAPSVQLLYSFVCSKGCN